MLFASQWAEPQTSDLGQCDMWSCEPHLGRFGVNLRKNVRKGQKLSLWGRARPGVFSPSNTEAAYVCLTPLPDQLGQPFWEWRPSRSISSSPADSKVPPKAPWTQVLSAFTVGLITIKVTCICKYTLPRRPCWWSFLLTDLRGKWGVEPMTLKESLRPYGMMAPFSKRENEGPKMQNALTLRHTINQQ